MNLTFTEIDDDDNLENLDYNYKTYYDNLIPQANKEELSHYNNNHDNTIIEQKQFNKNQNQNPRVNANKKLYKPKKKAISYDDILSSMNTVVINGKLEFIRKDTLQNIIENHQQQHQQPLNKKRVTFNQPQLQNQQQIDKSSYIYSKFFKDYNDPSQSQNVEPQRPLTKKELIRQLIINKVNAINERNRIAEIKSTKLMFNNNNNRNIVINSSLNPPNPNNGMNHLFKFK